MAFRRLDTAYTPQLLNLQLDSDLIDAMEEELAQAASKDQNHCSGYFPSLLEKKEINSNLPICKRFALDIPSIQIEGKDYSFNFLRYSSTNQLPLTKEQRFHIDSDAKTALTGNLNQDHEVWRLLLNLSPAYKRTIWYLDIAPNSVELEEYNGYISYPNTDIGQSYLKSIVLSPRKKSRVHALLFCANKVLHQGKELDGGHFIGAYGNEYHLART